MSAIQGAMAYAVLLLLSLSLVNVALADPCKDYNTCGECVGQMYSSNGVQNYCAWCGDAENPHCITDTSSLQCGSATPIRYKASVVENTVQGSDAKREVKPERYDVYLRKGDPLDITVNVKITKDKSLDFYYLMDLSQSMENDRKALESLTPKLFDEMSKVCTGTCETRFAFGSFIEKPITPVGTWLQPAAGVPAKPFHPDHMKQEPYNYMFKHHQSMTTSKTAFSSSVASQVARPNIDHPEAMLDALMQVAVCDEPIFGWNSGNRKMVFIVTDADFHTAGDGELMGIYERHPETCYFGSSVEYFQLTQKRRDYKMSAESLNYDYPSISQVRSAMISQNIVPVFGWFTNSLEDEADNAAVYRDLINQLQFGRQQQILRDNPESIIDALKNAYLFISTTLRLLPNKNGYESFVKKMAPNGGLIENANDADKTYTFTVTLELTGEGAGQDKVYTAEDRAIVGMSILGFGGIEVHVRTDNTPCNKCAAQTSSGGFSDLCLKCNKDNTERCDCGICQCKDGNSGATCECSGATDQCGTPKCSGNGVCECNACKCYEENGVALFTGNQCECDASACPTTSAGECNGKGECRCGKCVCQNGWGGVSCACAPVSNPCSADTDCGTDDSGAATGSCIAVAGCPNKRCVCNVVGWKEDPDWTGGPDKCTCANPNNCQEKNYCGANLTPPRGQCLCDSVCKCNEGWESEKNSDGSPKGNCDCSKAPCNNGAGCGDKGTCVCGQCVCQYPWTKTQEDGPCDCEDSLCPTGSDPLAVGPDAQRAKILCSSHGVCRCPQQADLALISLSSKFYKGGVSENRDDVDLQKTRCICDRDPNDPSKSFYGNNCGCQDIQCPTGPKTGLICTHGPQYCGCNGKCDCPEGWSGDACECDDTACPKGMVKGNALVCSGDNGECQCNGLCKCNAGWGNPLLKGQDNCACPADKKCPAFQGASCSGQKCVLSYNPDTFTTKCNECECDLGFGGINGVDVAECRTGRGEGCDCSCDRHKCSLLPNPKETSCRICTTQSNRCGLRLNDGSNTGFCECGFCKCKEGWDNVLQESTGTTEFQRYKDIKESPCVCKKDAQCPTNVFGTCSGNGECDCADQCKCNELFRGKAAPESLTELVALVNLTDVSFTDGIPVYSDCNDCIPPAERRSNKNKDFVCPAERCASFTDCESCSSYYPGQSPPGYGEEGDGSEGSGRAGYLRDGCSWCYNNITNRGSCVWVVDALQDIAQCPQFTVLYNATAGSTWEKAYYEPYVALNTTVFHFRDECPAAVITDTDTTNISITDRKEFWPALGGAFAAIVLIGLLSMLAYKYHINRLDKKEWERFESERRQARWKADNNPLFQSSVQETQNPLYVVK